MGREIMTAASFQAQIKSLQTQLTVLRAQLGRTRETDFVPQPFSALYGILSGKAATSEQDVRNAQYRFHWEGEEQG